MVATDERVRNVPTTMLAPVGRAVSVAIAHQKGGVDLPTPAALLAAEVAWLRPDWTVLVEDRDPDANLTARWPGDSDQVQLVAPGAGEGNLRIIDTGPGQPRQVDQVLAEADYVVIPVRMAPMSVQAIGLMLPRLERVQRRAEGRARREAPRGRLRARVHRQGPP